MTQDELSSIIFSKPQTAASTGKTDGTDMRPVLGGFSSPEEYAIAHANWLGTEKAKASGGHYTLEDMFSDLTSSYKEGNDAAQKERDRQADVAKQAQINALDIQKQAQLNVQDIQKQETLKEFDVNKTRQPTDDERKQVSDLVYSWNGLKDLQNSYNQALKTAPNWTGNIGGLVAGAADAHNVSKGFLPDDIKAFNTQAATNAGPLLQGILQYTAGADSKQNVMEHTIPNLMPSLLDSPQAFTAKMQQLQIAAARRAEAFVAARAGKNAAGNPAVDLSSFNDALAEPKQFLDNLNKQTQQTTSTATKNSVMTPQTQNAYNQLRNAASRGTNATPVPMVSNPQQPPAPSPSGALQPQAQSNASDFSNWMAKMFGSGASTAYGGT